MNALRRAGLAWSLGQEVDQFEAGLAVAGLVATGLVLSSGGASATVKVGVTGLRLARKLGSVPARLQAELSDAARALNRWDTLPHVLARLARLAEVAGPDTRRALAVLGKARAFRALGRAGDGGACAGANRRGAGGGRQTGAAPRARPAKGSCQAPRFRAMITPS